MRSDFVPSFLRVWKYSLRGLGNRLIFVERKKGSRIHISGQNYFLGFFSFREKTCYYFPLFFVPSKVFFLKNLMRCWRDRPSVCSFFQRRFFFFFRGNHRLSLPCCFPPSVFGFFCGRKWEEKWVTCVNWSPLPSLTFSFSLLWEETITIELHSYRWYSFLETICLKCFIWHYFFAILQVIKFKFLSKQCPLRSVFLAFSWRRLLSGH